MLRKKLSIKQKLFVRDYLKNKNGTEAVINAGYKINNRITAGAIASENLKKPLIKKSIEDYLAGEHYQPSDSIKRLIKTAEAGAGVKATAQEAIRADELLLKLSNQLIDKRQSVIFNIDNLDSNQLFNAKEKFNKLQQKISTRK